MRPSHARAVNALPVDARHALLGYFRVSPQREALTSEQLAEAGLAHADCVLALLHLDMVVEAEQVWGRRVTVCPPALRLPVPMEISDKSHRSGDDRRLRWLTAHVPALPTTGRFYRLRALRDGMSISQYLVRGGQRRDVRVALQRGWVTWAE